MEIKEFTKKAIDKFTVNITDSLFLLIQNDKELMQDYLSLLESNKRSVVNSRIAKAVKKEFDLKNIGKSHNPISTLIVGFEQFEAEE